MSAVCEAQSGYKLVLWLNAVTIPQARFCPHPAVDGTKYCGDHQTVGSRRL